MQYAYILSEMEMIQMHALPLLAAFVDPYEVFFRQALMPRRTTIRFGDEPIRKHACSMLKPVAHRDSSA